MLDDFKYFIGEFINLFRGKSKKNELEDQTALDVRIRLRRTSFFYAFILSLIIFPCLFGMIFYVFFSPLNDWWDWDYWTYYMIFSIVMYVISTITIPKIKRAKIIYALHIVFLSYPFIYIIVLIFIMVNHYVPASSIRGYYVIHGFAVFGGIILFRSLYKNIEKDILNVSTVGKLKYKPVWDDSDFITNLGDDRPNNWVSGSVVTILFSIGILLFFIFTALEPVEQLASYLGVISAITMLIFVDAFYRMVIIYHLIDDLEKNIFESIILEEL